MRAFEQTLVSALQTAARGDRGMRFIDGASVERVCAYRDLWQRAHQYLGYLQTQGVEPGTEVVFQVDDRLALLTLFWACILGGIIPIPLAVGADDEHRLKVFSLWPTLANPRLVGDVATLDRLRTFAANTAGLTDGMTAMNAACVSLEAIHRHTQPGVAATVDADDIAFIQYSSGSTGRPKGVVLTHANLVANTRDLIERLNTTRSDTFMSWLPLSHDMGMVFFHLTPVVGALDQIQMDTATFVRQPLSWLQKAADHHATILGTPNFGLRHVLKRLNADARIASLASVRAIVVGAEPIAADVFRQFTTALEPFGLASRSGCPGYGLAEASVGVAMAAPGDGLATIRVDRHALKPGDAIRCVESSDPAGMELAIIGQPFAQCEVQIRNADNTLLADDRIGHIHVRGANVTRGYYRAPEETRRTIDRQGWLNTGDLGFMHHGRLVVAGRAKEIIFVNGENYYPHDVERVIETHEPAVAGKIAVCGVFDPDQQAEKVIAFVRHRGRSPTLDALAGRLRRIVYDRMRIAVDQVIAVSRIPRTTSGKPQRLILAQQYLDGGFTATDGCAAASVESLPDQPEAPVDAPAPIPCDAPAPHRCAATDRTLEPIAVIGMGCRLPGGVSSPAAFWNFLKAGGDAVDFIPPTRWNNAAYYDSDPDRVGGITTRHGAFLENVSDFDPLFFGISPREAASMDPQQRLLLEVAWDAFEHAGMAPATVRGSATGVYAGISVADYREMMIASNDPVHLNGHYLTGNTFSACTGRVSYALGLRGPNLAIDTACSSSLVAVHQAGRALQTGDCDLALAGGVNLILSPTGMMILSRARMLSPTGRCHTFDRAADGYVRGEGCGLLVLKRLADAERDGDRIEAVILASAVNQDGGGTGFTLPNGEAQQALLTDAWQRAGIAPGDLDYLEAHGTGTALGDPIELRALGELLRGRLPDGRRLPIGSVKTNLGHQESAAGATALLKVILALKYQEIPPHLHFHDPNPLVDWDELPLQVVTDLRPWPRDAQRRRIAGVSGFGFSGTNAHIVLAEPPPSAGNRSVAVSPPHDRPRHLLTLSAPDTASLVTLADRYVKMLQAGDGTMDPGDVCFTANTGRNRFPERLAVSATSTAGLATSLAAFTGADQRPPAGLHQGRAADPKNRPAVVFLFSGQGSQYSGMGQRLYATQPVFRDALDACAAGLRDHLDHPLLTVMHDPEYAGLLNETRYTQCALFSLEMALVALLRQWGIQADVLLGHSVGEIAAACAAGLLPLTQGLAMIACRGQLMQSLPRGGGMLAVRASESMVRQWLADEAPELALAAINGPQSCVVSGPADRLAAWQTRIAATNVKTRPLTVSHAFHSPLMEPMMAPFREALQALDFQPPDGAVISNVTGACIEPAQLAGADYWVQHVRQPVRFYDGMRSAWDMGGRIFVEIGPRPTLLGMGRQCVADAETAHWMPLLHETVDDWQQMLSTLGALFVNGIEFDATAFERGYPARRRVALPTTPFRRRRYWFACSKGGTVPMLRDSQTVEPTASGACDHESSRDGWCYALNWQPVAAIDEQIGERACWLVLTGESGFSAAMMAGLRARGQDVVRVQRGTEFARLADGVYEVNPCRRSDWDQLITQLARDGIPWQGILYAWSLDDGAPVDRTTMQLTEFIRIHCGGLLSLVQALIDAGVTETPIRVLTHRAIAVDGDDPTPVVEGAPLWGMGDVIGLEYPGLWGGLIDLAADADAGDPLCREILFPDGEPRIAIRGDRRFAARLSRYTMGDDREPVSLRADGLYLVTGGLGALGLQVAQWLLNHGARRLVLLSRRAPSADVTARLDAMRAAGATLDVVQADVADADAMQAVFDSLHAGRNRLRGIFHAAGVSAVDSLMTLTWTGFAEVVKAKILGGWNLHRLSRGEALDLFVCFSSIAAVWGSRGQSHYAAGNRFLDALAHHRRALGEPGVSINWGPWQGGGMASDAAQTQLAAMGVRALPPDEALAVMHALIRDGATQTVVADMAWEQFIDLYATQGNTAMFENLRAPAEDGGEQPPAAAPPPWPSACRDRSPDAASAWVLHQLESEVSAIMGFDAGEGMGAPESTFADLGMDSFLALELRNRLQQLTGLSLPATMVFDFPTPAELAGHLSALMRKPTQTVASPPPGLPGPDVPDAGPPPSDPDDITAAFDRELEELENDMR